jgi:hypothetical protein
VNKEVGIKALLESASLKKYYTTLSAGVGAGAYERQIFS